MNHLNLSNKTFSRRRAVRVLVCGLFLALVSAHPCCILAENVSTIPLASLDLSKMTAGYSRPRAGAGLDGGPLYVAGQQYSNSVCTHAPSEMHILLDKGTRRFTALVGVADVKGNDRASIVFKVYADQQLVFNSGVMRSGNAPKQVDLDLRKAERLVLVVTDAGDGMDYDHAVWADAKFEIKGVAPQAAEPPAEKEYILTPKPGPAPAINGPPVFGVRPGNPFLYRIPATGERPMRFAAEGLPASLRLDPESGIITGRAPEKRGEFLIHFGATNSHGGDRRAFKLVVGDTLALTPPMGWNSWYIHYLRVGDADIRAAADAMVSSGMADFGYMYVNIDDGWSKPQGREPYRDDKGAILPNERFPDMNGLTSYIHERGLRAGIYSSPGPWTCGNHVASLGHEQLDAETFARWGFDFLKYDWCSYAPHNWPPDHPREDFKKPYLQMGANLQAQGRDLVYNLCQYGMGRVWEWGPEAGGNCWRTTGDLGPMEGGYLHVGLINAQYHEYARPGHWNDPDYLLLGWVGDPHTMGFGSKVTMKPSRQYQYMSMWSLMAAPLFFSGDMTKLDAFTLNLLCNREVIAVNQDALGRQGRIVERDGEHFVMVKDLADGSKAVGIFNTAGVARTCGVLWSTLGIEGRWNIRDLWRQKNEGASSKKYETTIPAHGVSLILLSPNRK